MKLVHLSFLLWALKAASEPEQSLHPGLGEETEHPPPPGQGRTGINSPQAWNTRARSASALEVWRTSLWSSNRASGPWVRRIITDMSSRSGEPDTGQRLRGPPAAQPLPRAEGAKAWVSAPALPAPWKY